MFHVAWKLGSLWWWFSLDRNILENVWRKVTFIEFNLIIVFFFFLVVNKHWISSTRNKQHFQVYILCSACCVFLNLTEFKHDRKCAHNVTLTKITPSSATSPTTKLSGIFFGQSGTEAGFLLILRCFPLIVIPPTPRTHISFIHNRRHISLTIVRAIEGNICRCFLCLNIYLKYRIKIKFGYFVLYKFLKSNYRLKLIRMLFLYYRWFIRNIKCR